MVNEREIAGLASETLKYELWSDPTRSTKGVLWETIQRLESDLNGEEGGSSNIFEAINSEAEASRQRTDDPSEEIKARLTSSNVRLIGLTVEVALQVIRKREFATELVGDVLHWQLPDFDNDWRAISYQNTCERIPDYPAHIYPDYGEFTLIISHRELPLDQFFQFVSYIAEFLANTTATEFVEFVAISPGSSVLRFRLKKRAADIGVGVISGLIAAALFYQVETLGSNTTCADAMASNQIISMECIDDEGFYHKQSIDGATGNGEKLHPERNHTMQVLDGFFDVSKDGSLIFRQALDYYRPIQISNPSFATNEEEYRRDTFGITLVLDHPDKLEVPILVGDPLDRRNGEDQPPIRYLARAEWARTDDRRSISISMVTKK